MPTAAHLSIVDLTTELSTAAGTVRAVDHVSFEVARGTTVGVVGESGCGKSMTALSILRLVQPPVRIASGRVLYDGKDLLVLPERELRQIRGNRISMVFQEPMTALNPVLTVGEQVAETVRLHQGLARRDAWTAAIEALRHVGIPAAEERCRSFPHELSGGMRQRVMIAIALACRPDLLIADEPTTSLDVTIQAQILDLLARLRRELGMSLLLISHDLGVIAETCDEVVVMYAGRVVERAPAAALFARPLHPYTAGLLGSVPPLDANEAAADRLTEIAGAVPPLDRLPAGCKFQDRCPFARDLCRADEPEQTTVPGSEGRTVRCHFPLVTGQ